MTQPLYAQRYRLVEALPPGRALAAHRAEDPSGRPVVITVVRPADPDWFLRWMGLVAAARHLDLAAVVDVGQDGPDVYVAAEDVRGQTLAAALARGPLPVATAAMAGASAAAGLAALHAQGAAHGGLTSESLVRAADGTVKLTGAGLAMAEPRPDLRPGAPAAEAHYLSPEEAAGAWGDAASDVYRLGLVLYEMLTGTPAFDGPDAATVAREHREGVVQPPQFRAPDVPPALAQVVLRAMEKDPARRGTAAQLQADLSAVLGSARVEERPEPPEPKGRGWVWLVGILAAVAVAAVVALWALGVFSPEEKAGTVAVPDLAGMTQERAQKALDEVGLVAGDVTKRKTDTAAPGVVVGQDPAAGTKVADGSAVDVEVAEAGLPTPPPKVAVPNVVGLTQDEAIGALQDLGFSVVATSAPSLTPAGEVAEQTPAAGVMAEAGSTVKVTVSTGPASAPASPSPDASASP